MPCVWAQSLIVPFIFVLDSAFLMGGVASISAVISEALVGICLIAGALQGFLPIYKSLIPFGRLLNLIAGLLIAVPELSLFDIRDFGNTELALIGLVFCFLGILWDRFTQKVAE